MSDLSEILKEKGYRVFGNKTIHPDPIVAVLESWGEKASDCDVKELYQSIIRFCEAKIKEDAKKRKSGKV